MIQQLLRKYYRLSQGAPVLEKYMLKKEWVLHYTVLGKLLPKATFFAFCSVHICIAVCSCGGRCSDFQRIFCSAPQGLCFQFTKLIIRKVDHTPPYLHCKSLTKRTNFTFFFFFIFTDDCFWQA